jgi:hypothetical protein
MDGTVAAGLIAGGSAVVSSALTGALTYAVTGRQVRQQEATARRQFVLERQADAYVIVRISPGHRACKALYPSSILGAASLFRGHFGWSRLACIPSTLRDRGGRLWHWADLPQMR